MRYKFIPDLIVSSLTSGAVTVFIAPFLVLGYLNIFDRQEFHSNFEISHIMMGWLIACFIAGAYLICLCALFLVFAKPLFHVTEKGEFQWIKGVLCLIGLVPFVIAGMEENGSFQLAFAFSGVICSVVGISIFAKSMKSAISKMIDSGVQWEEENVEILV